MTWHFCIFKLLWLAKSSETSVHDPYYCSTQNTDSQGYTCLKSSTEQQCFCVSSLSYQIRFSNYQSIDSTHLYMVGGCLQNITALLLGWGGVSRVREQIRKALNTSLDFPTHPDACSPSAPACCLGSGEPGLNPTPRLLPMPAMCSRSLWVNLNIGVLCLEILEHVCFCSQSKAKT